MKKTSVLLADDHTLIRARNAADFESAMRNAKDATLLLVNRQGSTMYLAV